MIGPFHFSFEKGLDVLSERKLFEVAEVGDPWII